MLKLLSVISSCCLLALGILFTDTSLQAEENAPSYYLIGNSLDVGYGSLAARR